MRIPTSAVLAALLFAASCSSSPTPTAKQEQSTTPAANGTGAAPAPPGGGVVPTSFTRFDELTTVTALCGAVKRGSSTNTMSGTPEKVEGYLDEDGEVLYEVLLSKDYQDKGGPKHLLVVGSHGIEDGEIRSVQAQSVDVAAAVLEPKPGKWAPVVLAKSLTSGGQYSHSPSATLVQIGTARYALRIGQGSWYQGNELDNEQWFEPVGGKFLPVVSVSTSASVSEQNDPNPPSWNGKLEVMPTAGAEVFDMKLTVSGTYKTEAGKLVKMNGPMILKMQGGTYKPVDSTPALAAQWKALTSIPW
jgi:hypothetical protein